MESEALRSPRRRGNRPLHRTGAQLIEAAAGLIEEVGVAGFTGDEVLRRVGLTSGVLYYHFGDVDGLCNAAMAHLYVKWITSDTEAILGLVERCATLEEFRREILALLKVVYNPDRSSRRLHRAATLGLSIGNDQLRVSIAAAQDQLTALIESVMCKVDERGWLQVGIDAHALAVFFQSFLLGLVIDDIANRRKDAAAWDALVAHVVDTAILRRS